MDFESLLFRIRYVCSNWKMLLHLFFRTYHFGVNNDAWEPHRSLFGLPFHKTVKRLVVSYKMMRIRAFIGFIPLNDAIKLFPGYARKHGYHPIRSSQ